eukprot:1725570-Rhodomonas_salina.1
MLGDVRYLSPGGHNNAAPKEQRDSDQGLAKRELFECLSTDNMRDAGNGNGVGLNLDSQTNVNPAQHAIQVSGLQLSPIDRAPSLSSHIAYHATSHKIVGVGNKANDSDSSSSFMINPNTTAGLQINNMINHEDLSSRQHSLPTPAALVAAFQTEGKPLIPKLALSHLSTQGALASITSQPSARSSGLSSGRSTSREKLSTGPFDLHFELASSSDAVGIAASESEAQTSGKGAELGRG